MHIQHPPQAGGGRFSACEHDQTLGQLDYRRLDDRVIDAHHTFVDPAARGVAEALLQALADHAQAENLRIRPSCHYVAQKLPRSHPHLLAEPA